MRKETEPDRPGTLHSSTLNSTRNSEKKWCDSLEESHIEAIVVVSLVRRVKGCERRFQTTNVIG